MDYDSKTATKFNLTARRVGFYLGTATLPNTPQGTGATVYLGEYHRTGFSFRSQTGFVHAEGVLIHGDYLLDGVRFRGSSATTATLQNSLIGPNGPVEYVAMQDGQADCVQTWGRCEGAPHVTPHPQGWCLRKVHYQRSRHVRWWSYGNHPVPGL